MHSSPSLAQGPQPDSEGAALLSPSALCSTVRLRLAVSSSAGLALKLKVSLYTGLVEPSTADVFLHLTNLLWFIRDTLTNTPEGQDRLQAGRDRQGAQPPACGSLGWEGTCLAWVPGPHYSQLLQPKGVTRGNGVD